MSETIQYCSVEALTKVTLGFNLRPLVIVISHKKGEEDKAQRDCEKETLELIESMAWLSPKSKTKATWSLKSKLN